jgi:4-amino-4-deoxy-L-arabinose transferase-like glycosyltransferase
MLLWTCLALAFRGALAFFGSEALASAERLRFVTDGTEFYTPIAMSLRSGAGYADKYGAPTAQHMPGYPLLIVAARSVVPTYEGAALAVQLVSGSIAVGLVYLLAAAFLQGVAAHGAALIALGWPDLVVYSLLNLSESPFLCFSLTGTLLLLRSMRKGGIAIAALLGAVAGLGLLVRESMIAFILAWTFSLLRAPVSVPPRRRALNAVVMLATIGLTLAPWWLRNLATFGEFIPLSTKGANNIYCGTLVRPYYFSDGRNESIPVPPDEQAREDAVSARIGAAGSFRDRERVWLEAAFENVRREPGRQLWHLARKCYFMWQPNIGPRHIPRVGFAPFLWIAAIAHWMLVGSGTAGLARLRHDRDVLLALIVPLLVVTVFHVVVGIGEPRYHLPLIPTLIVGSLALVAGARGIRPAGPAA